MNLPAAIEYDSAAHLLGRNVAVSIRRRAWRGQCLRSDAGRLLRRRRGSASFGTDRVCQTEIENLRMTAGVRDERIRWRDVAMHDAPQAAASSPAAI